MKLKEDVCRAFKRSYSDLKWFEKNYDRLKRRYDGRWVAVRDTTVVASSDTFEGIVASLKECDRKHAIIEYMQLEQVALIF